MACLMITTGDQAGTYYRLGSRTLTGGRDPARDIQVLDPKVSRKHFQVRKEGDDYVVVELKSLNGVFVNGTRIDGEQQLQDGDEIQVGDTGLTFYTVDDPDKTNALNKYRIARRDLREDRTVGG